MNKALYELMWASHRAECEAAVAYGTEGFLPDVRNEQQITATTNSINAFNLGAAQGIKSLLSHLHQNGYTIQSPTGQTIKPDRELDLGAAFSKWLLNPNPGLKLVPNTGYSDNAGIPVPNDLPEIKGVVLKGSRQSNTSRGYRPSTSSCFKKLNGFICLNGIPVTLDLKQKEWAYVASGDHAIERHFQIGNDRYVLRQYGIHPVHELHMQVVVDDELNHIEVTSLQIDNNHEILKALLPANLK